MCFVKSSAPAVQQVEEPVVKRYEADASITKNSTNNQKQAAIVQNLKTSPIGLSDEPEVGKKTLLGE